MKTTIYREDEETIFQSSHREWAEEQERRQQEHDERIVQQFLAAKLNVVDSRVDRIRSRQRLNHSGSISG